MLICVWKNYEVGNSQWVHSGPSNIWCQPAFRTAGVDVWHCVTKCHSIGKQKASSSAIRQHKTTQMDQNIQQELEEIKLMPHPAYSSSQYSEA